MKGVTSVKVCGKSLFALWGKREKTCLEQDICASAILPQHPSTPTRDDPPMTFRDGGEPMKGP
jgi:hypothetical protein